MSAIDKIKSIQTILGVVADGKFGMKSEAALDDLIDQAADEQRPPSGNAHSVMASSFADPADVAAFKKCKAQGKSDQECFKVGDNGVGKWGDDTTGPVPMCALPPDDWEIVSNPRGKKVSVTCEGRTVVCELRDTMPRKKNIKNGAGIDLNEAAWKALGHKPPQMRSAAWQWV